MPGVTVTPQAFELVDFDHDLLVGAVTDLARRLGLDHLDVHVAVAEAEMLPRVKSIDARPPGAVEVAVTGAAIEDTHAPRTVSTAKVDQVLGVALRRAADRLDPAFAGAPAEDELSLRQRTAWEASAEGRMAAAGLPARIARRRYHFRLRHGFADGVDAVFDRLWSDPAPTWDLIEACCQETAALDPGPLTPTQA